MGLELGPVKLKQVYLSRDVHMQAKATASLLGTSTKDFVEKAILARIQSTKEFIEKETGHAVD